MAVARILAVCAVPDQQTGLYVALVTDERGVSLGLVWSSDESIAEVLRTETGVYPCIKTGSAVVVQRTVEWRESGLGL